MSAPFISGRSSNPENDLEALLVRMRHRHYPETIPVLASYWLKTVCDSGHSRSWWKQLDGLLNEAISDGSIHEPSRQSLKAVRGWIENSGVLNGDVFDRPPERLEPFRPNLRPEWLGPYIRRLLNEWLSVEVASFLIEGNELRDTGDSGIPVLAVGKALERLLVRERLSPGTLEMLLDPALFSPHYVNPADAEVLRDVVLALVGRTWAAPLPVIPAIVVAVAADSTLPPGFRDLAGGASVTSNEGNEKIRVPIAASQAAAILRHAPMRMGSIILTADGRWWESENLESGEQNSVVFRLGGRLRIDNSADHARLRVPWPEMQLTWSGGVHLPDFFEIFGREWRPSSWESHGDHAWLNLVFSRVMPIVEIQPADTHFRRSHPASVDMAWAAFEDAIAAAIDQKCPDPIEHLRRPEFIPLGRAILALAESMQHWRLPKPEKLETQLKAIRHFQSQLREAYGGAPWKILPASVRAMLLKRRKDEAVTKLVGEVFDGLPEDFTARPLASSPRAA